MDRDNRWERVKKAYDLLVLGKGTAVNSAEEAIKNSYANNVTDEFIEPAYISANGQPIATIKEGDVVISFNFRTDRPREIVSTLTQKDFPEFEMKKLNLHLYTMTSYDATFENVRVIYEKDNLVNTLGEVLTKVDRTQVRIAETEKYPHVTFFFSGGREEVFPKETRILVNSPKVATYDLQPEMSAPEVKDKIIASMQNDKPNFFCLNFANPDMVGHTGVYNAIQKAVEIFYENRGELHLDTAEAYIEYAQVFLAMNDAASAKKYFKKAFDIRLNKLGEKHPDTIEVVEFLNNI